MVRKIVKKPRQEPRFQTADKPIFPKSFDKMGLFFYFVAFLLLFLSDNGASGHFR